MTTFPYTVRRLNQNDVLAATEICAQAMLDNPIHVRVFGAAATVRERRLKRFFPGLLAYVLRKGDLFGAFAGDKLIGVLGMLPPTQCQPSLRDLWRLLPRLLTSTQPLGTLRLIRWLMQWATIDPATPHWHLGPLAVAPAWQQQGVGTYLIELACDKGAGDDLYLETDKLSNVELYTRFGFQTLATPSVLATPSWVMMRPAQPPLAQQQVGVDRDKFTRCLNQ